MRHAVATHKRAFFQQEKCCKERQDELAATAEILKPRQRSCYSWLSCQLQLQPRLRCNYFQPRLRRRYCQLQILHLQDCGLALPRLRANRQDATRTNHYKPKIWAPRNKTDLPQSTGRDCGHWISWIRDWVFGTPSVPIGLCCYHTTLRRHFRDCGGTSATAAALPRLRLSTSATAGKQTRR